MSVYDWNPSVEEWQAAFETLRSDNCSLQVFHGKAPFVYEYNGRKYDGKTVNISYTATHEQIEYSVAPIEHIIADYVFKMLCPTPVMLNTHYILGFEYPEIQKVDSRVNILFRVCFTMHNKQR